MSRLHAVLLWMMTATYAAKGYALQPQRVELLCHRTANEDVPENTLESLEQAALLGCDVVEIDLRRTLDGEIVLNHDGILERLTDGTGEAETTYYDDLRLRDAGAWMSARFRGLHLARFDDALRLARSRNIQLMLDIKQSDTEPQIRQMVRSEGMQDTIRTSDPATKWVQPDVTAEQIKAHHDRGEKVIVSFSANGHEMDLEGMKAAVIAGADGLFVDYPRLGADAVGRPVEQKLHLLSLQASAGESAARAKAILELSHYRGFALEARFAHWLLDADDPVSRAAAVALATARPETSPAVFAEALRSQQADVRANAAWALGMLSAPANAVLPLLHDKDPRVLQETLMALGRMPGKVHASVLLPLLSHENPSVRGAAAIALARHQPNVAIKTIPARLRAEVQTTVRLDDDYARRGRPQLTQAEIQEVNRYFQCEMKLVQAISMLKGATAAKVFEEQALRPSVAFTQMLGQVSAFQLWDRIGIDPRPAVEALGSANTQMSDRAEWMLVEGGPAVLPEVRNALGSADPAVRKRAIRIVAWQGDRQSLQVLRTMQHTDLDDADLTEWAIEKIESLQHD